MTLSKTIPVYARVTATVLALGLALAMAVLLIPASPIHKHQAALAHMLENCDGILPEFRNHCRDIAVGWMQKLAPSPE